MIHLIYRPSTGGLMVELAPDQLAAALADPRALIWADLDGEDPGAYHPILTDIFKFHSLAIEDALLDSHSPKLNDWVEYLYVVLHAVDFDVNLLDVDTHEVDFFVGKNYLVTHHVEPVRAIERIRTACQRDERHLLRGPDYLMYEIADNIVSDFLPCVDALDEEIDRVEEEVFDRPTSGTLSRIFTLKRAVIHLRRILSPQREVLNRLARDDYAPIEDKERVYFRGIYDQLVRLYDINESLRDLVSGSLDMYLSVVSNRLNQVMKVLTIVTVLGLPLTFLTGFFGMNFFGATYEVPAPVSGLGLFIIALTLMVGLPLIMWYWFKHRGWA
ncbi:MAG: magnesium/cobalt transporter CorA [Chloroflexi bacterium]|nr:magnesium/cobalt transporter CorA [Chloroflexota bacterium]